MNNTAAAERFDRRAVKLVVFDFDGTLAELTIDFQAMRQDVAGLAARRGWDIDAMGKPYTLEAVEALAGLHGIEGAAFAREANQVIEAREIASAREGRLFPGVRRALTDLRKVGLKTAVITRNCRAAVLTVFPDILDYCDRFIPRDDVVRTKPHPEHLEAVLTGLACAAGETILAGDHPMDIVTAHRVGAWGVGLPTGRMSKADLHEADFLFDSVADLAAFLVNGARPE